MTRERLIQKTLQHLAQLPDQKQTEIQLDLLHFPLRSPLLCGKIKNS